MKTHYKIATLALALAVGMGGSLVLAQAPAAPTINPPTTVKNTPVTPTSRGTAGRGERSGQPHMEEALNRLREARRQLDDAIPDKGGFRERAIASTDRAIKDVEDGVQYAIDHREEFRGARGRGPRGTEGATVTPPGGS